MVESGEGRSRKRKRCPSHAIRVQRRALQRDEAEAAAEAEKAAAKAARAEATEKAAARALEDKLQSIPISEDTEEAIISLEKRRTITLEQLVDLMERLKEAITDGAVMNTLQGVLRIVISIGDCDCKWRL